MTARKYQDHIRRHLSICPPLNIIRARSANPAVGHPTGDAVQHAVYLELSRKVTKDTNAPSPDDWVQYAFTVRRWKSYRRNWKRSPSGHRSSWPLGHRKKGRLLELAAEREEEAEMNHKLGSEEVARWNCRRADHLSRGSEPAGLTPTVLTRRKSQSQKNQNQENQNQIGLSVVGRARLGNKSEAPGEGYAEEIARRYLHCGGPAPSL